MNETTNIADVLSGNAPVKVAVGIDTESAFKVLGGLFVLIVLIIIILKYR